MAAQELVTLTPAEYSDQQVDLIRRTVAAGCSHDELALFLEVCRGTGLNPFMRQIYAIKRGDKMTVQTGIDGYRLLASRTGDLAGIDDAAYDDESAEHPVWASVTVWRFVRGHRVAFTAKARWREYAQVTRDGNPSGLWGKMPYLMLAKCAEALALRKAFPAELSGVYTADEMEQADNPTPLPYVESEHFPATPEKMLNPKRDPNPPRRPYRTEDDRPEEPVAASPVAVPDRYAAALGRKEILDLLIQRQRFNDADRRTELESVFAAIEASGQLVNMRTVKQELQQRLIDLSGLETGAPGN